MVFNDVYMIKQCPCCGKSVLVTVELGRFTKVPIESINVTLEKKEKK